MARTHASRGAPTTFPDAAGTGPPLPTAGSTEQVNGSGGRRSTRGVSELEARAQACLRARAKATAGLAAARAQQPHAQRVRARLSEWRAIGASRQVLQWLGEGVRIPWAECGPPAPFHQGVASFSPPERAWLSAERDRCLSTGAWRRATDLRFVSRAFVTYHKGKPRLVIDLRWINEHCQKRTCKFESLSSLRRMARRHDWMVSLDMSDAYHHVGVHESDVHYFTFALETAEGVEYFSTPALNFGWTLSPWVFTTVMKTVVRYLRNPEVATRPRYGVPQKHALPWRQRGQHAQPLAESEVPLAALAGGGDGEASSEAASDVASGTGSFGSERGPLARDDGRWRCRSELGRWLVEHTGCGTADLDQAAPQLQTTQLGTPLPHDTRAHAPRLPRWRRHRERPAERAVRRLRELLDARAGAPHSQAELRPPRQAAQRAWCRALAAFRTARPHRRQLTTEERGRCFVLAEHAAMRCLARLTPQETATSKARRSAAGGTLPRPVRTLPWLDDFAFFQQGTYEEACEARDHVGETFDSLGLLRAPDKGQWEPSHFLEDHLGYSVDTERGLFLLTPRREAKLAVEAHLLLRRAAANRRLVPARSLSSFCGLGQSSTLALPLGRFMLRALYDDMAARSGGPRDGLEQAGAERELAERGHLLPLQPRRGHWRGNARLGKQSLEDLRWWASLRGSRHVGRAIWRRPETRVLHTDASDLGWGGTVDHERLAARAPTEWAAAVQQAAPAAVARQAGLAAEQPRRTPAAGFWSPEELPLHITFKELRAVRLSVEHFLPELTGRRVLLHEDNQAVVWILTNLVTRSPELMQELRALWALLDAHDIELRAVYIRSAANLIADYASRLACKGDYIIARARFDALQSAWGECTVDGFASPATALLPRWWSEALVEGAEATDAFAQEWRGELVWAHPPPGLLLHVAQFLEETGAAAHVCAPYWPGAAWYSMLLDLSDEHVVMPPGTLQRVAADAAPRLGSWPVVVFRVPGGRRVR